MSLFSPTRGCPKEAILDWIADWCDLLAQGRVAEACARLDEPNSYGHNWSPEELVAAKEDTFGPKSRFRLAHPGGLAFTRPEDSSGNSFANVEELSDGSGYWAEYNLPISGEFSDLTAQFRFRWARGRLLASLHDLRVL